MTAKLTVKSDAGKNETKQAPLSRHKANSAQTRERLLLAAQSLYAARGIDAVSFNEITVAAGQKNRNALQYHFGNKETLLTAITTKHSSVIFQMRREYLAQIPDKLASKQWTAAKATAKTLVMPIADYVATHSDGVEYLKIVSHLAAIDMTNSQKESGINIATDKDFAKLMNNALSHLKPTESKRRIFLAVGFAFHSLADIYRASADPQAKSFIQEHKKMIEQLVIAIEAIFAAKSAS